MQKKKTRLIDLLTSNNYVENICFIGKTGTGKTTKIIEYLGKSKYSKIDIVYTNENRQLIENKRKINLININSFFKVIEFYKPKDRLLIFDDMKMYISVNPNEKNTKLINEFLARSRHNNNTFFFSFHSISQMPTFLFTYINKFLLFKSEITNNSDFPYKDKIKEVLNEVNNNNNLHYCKELIV